MLHMEPHKLGLIAMKNKNEVADDDLYGVNLISFKIGSSSQY